MFSSVPFPLHSFPFSSLPFWDHEPLLFNPEQSLQRFTLEFDIAIIRVSYFYNANVRVAASSLTANQLPKDSIPGYFRFRPVRSFTELYLICHCILCGETSIPPMASQREKKKRGNEKMQKERRRKGEEGAEWKKEDGDGTFGRE